MTMDSEDGGLVAATGMAGALASAEIDVQIATAKRFPRHTTKEQVDAVKRQVLALATSSAEAAEDCFYALPRAGKTIEGASIRFAEILSSRWGNCRVGSRVVGEDGDCIVVQGVFHDLETNTATMKDVRRRITDREGRRFSADMVAVTANAAASLAIRNAVLAGVPKAVWQDIYDQVRRLAIGDTKTLADRRAKAFAHLAKMGISEAQVLAHLKRATADAVDAEDLFALRNTANAIRDGELDIDRAFPPLAPQPSTKPTEAKEAKA